MDIAELRAALVGHFSAKGIELGDDAQKLDLVLVGDAERWGLVLCADTDKGGMAYLGHFEIAMQRLMDVRQADPNIKLGLGIAFAATAQGQSPSYRRALKKYSNSIVFADLGIHLVLVTGPEAVDLVAPEEANGFLRDLDRWIAARIPMSDQSGSAS